MSVSPILSKFGYFWQYIKFGWGEPQAMLKYHQNQIVILNVVNVSFTYFEQIWVFLAIH